jgi:hypothetical protein
VIRHGGLGGAVRQRLSGAIGPAPMANATCSPGAVADKLPGEVAGAGAQRPPDPGSRLLRQAGQRAARRRVGERRDDGRRWMAALRARSWGGLPISASAGPPARS